MKALKYTLLTLVFSPLFLFSQMDKKFNKIDSLLKINQPNAAQKELWKIIDKGEKENDQKTLIKAFTYFNRVTYPLESLERAQLFFKIDEKGQKLSEPAKTLINLQLTQELIYNYNSWFGYGRNEIYDSIDLSTQTNRSSFILERIENLENDLTRLKNYRYKDYLQTITKEVDEEKDQVDMFFSLYDYGIYRLIEYYQSSIISSYGILKNTTEAKSSWYSTPYVFKNASFDKSFLTHRILNLFQRLENTYQNNYNYQSIAAYQRLKYLNSQFTKEEYVKMLEDAWDKQYNYFIAHSARSKFLFEREKLNYENGNTYHFKTKPEVKGDIKKAFDNLTAELKAYPESDFSPIIQDLINLIQVEEFGIKIPDINLPEDVIPIKIEHRNLSEYVLRIYKLKKYDPLEDKTFKTYIQKDELELVRTIDLTLENENLYQMRSTEIITDKLSSPGVYYVVATKTNMDLKPYALDNDKWNELKLSSVKFFVSEISVSASTSEGELKLIVVDQKTGKPISDAEVILYERLYYNSKREIKKRGKTDANGIFKTTNLKSGYSQYVVKYKNSVLSSSEYSYSPSQPVSRAYVEILTDRAIYRPGHTVYFKGISYKGKQNDFSVSPNNTIQIRVLDHSYQEIYKETFKTTEFGSFDGSVQIPENVPLGSYQIIATTFGGNVKSQDSYAYFSVEEYKRPTYEVKLNMPKEEAKLNDTVKVTGSAKAFAGYAIDGASVTYSVYRNWSRYWFFFNSASSGDLLKEGELTTGSDGKFAIDFFAETDPNAVPFAYYTYDILVKVTDLSGETHEQTLSLRLSEVGISLDIYVPEQLFANEDKIAIPKIINMAGEIQKNENLTAKLEVYKKIIPERFLDRIWTNAEFTKWTKQEETEFEKLYPYRILDSYQESSNEKLVHTLEFKMGDTLKLGQLIRGALNNEQGRYTLKFSYTTSTNHELTNTNNIEIIDVNAKEVPYSNSIWAYVSSNQVEVGEHVEFQVGTTFKNKKALVSFFRGKELVSQEWVSLSKRYVHNYTVQEQDRGILTFEVLLFDNGSFYSVTKRVDVPFTNKRLFIKTATFRDQLLPGQQEQWTFTIQDNHDNFVNTELAAAMYDASLDQFRAQSWYLYLYYGMSTSNNWNKTWNRGVTSLQVPTDSWKYSYSMNNGSQKYSNFLNYFKYRTYYDRAMPTAAVKRSATGATRANFDYDEVADYALEEVAIVDYADSPDEPQLEKSDLRVEDERESDGNEMQEADNQTQEVRSNFNETAFFYPYIYSSDEKEYVLDFTLPESLTRWKLLLFSHSKEMQVGTLTKYIEAKKDMMITANAPRFVRQGDEIDFAAKVINLIDKEQTLTISLELKNPENESHLPYIQGQTTKTVTVPANSSIDVNWNLNIGDVDLIEYTVTAYNDSISDGERNILPVLSNRILITETSHALLKEKGNITHTFDVFQNQNSPTIDNKTYTLEYIDNLAWQAVLALPYLSKIENRSSTALAESYYANAIAKNIIDKYPEVEKIFDQWKTKSPDVFLSELEKNPELKNILLNETPWVLDAKNESEQRRRIALLFEINQLKDKQQSILNELRKKQNSDGGFAWFDGGKSNLYITQNILNRFGQLAQFSIKIDEANSIILKAERYVVGQQLEYYKRYILPNFKDKKYKYRLSATDIYWLNSRRFYFGTKSKEIDEMVTYYEKRLQEDWTSYSPYLQSIIGLYFKARKFNIEAELIFSSLKDRAKKNTHLGMYWVENTGYFWYQNKISTQAMIINFFDAMGADEEMMDDARLWLILHKEANAWETSSETAEAIHAILLSGKDYLKNTPRPIIKVGTQELITEGTATENQLKVDWIPGLGQMKHKWNGGEIQKDLGTVQIEKFSEGPAVLNLYWQYTEDISAIKSFSDGSMKIQKTYRKIVPGAKHQEGIITNEYKVGDKIEVELIITVDRDLEFVHIKDLRPAGFELKDAISRYYWDGGLIYYQSPKDASMEYFVEWMNKGTYKLTYTVYATHSGKFSSGMANIQSFYAPKFSGHSDSKGIIIQK